MNDEAMPEKIDLEKVDWRGSREFFESLGEALDRLDDKDESYDFTWVGKRKSIIEAGAPINKTLRPDVGASKNWDTTENLFIEGDNLDALKLLQESYLGKVKMIYIDPPYNTGKDFVYHDNFHANVEQYDEDTEYKDDDGNIQFKKNEKSNGRYHSDWLSMMYPRLKLARNLLSADGVIFISIDDNEQANLKKLCDEIFGEDNFLSNITRPTGTPTGGGNDIFVGMADYVLVYARSVDVKITGTEFSEKDASIYDKEDERGRYLTRTLRRTGGEDRREDRPSMFFAVTAPDGTEIYPIGPTGYESRWICGIETFRTMESNGLIEWIKTKNGWNVHQKFYLEGRTKQPSNLWTGLEGNKQATRYVRALFDDKKLFDYPKPTALIRRMLTIATNQDSVVLDFFSGSASTADAVMQLNAEDSGNRKWIMVQLPEETDEKSEAFKAGYKTIPEISRERIRRAGDKIASEHPDAKVDYGFRALRIDDTNHKDVYRPAADYQQSMLDSLVDNIKEDRSDLDLLYGVLTATAWELNKPLETVELDGATVYKYDYFGEVSGLVACFADEISEETIKQIAQLKPLTAVFKESSFPNSQAKVNLAEHFRIISSDTKVKVI
ncbi:MAG: adenine-specific DNA-methyltransferase [Patescibacteria group bacterium]|nr:adenine-specific DNA-methyltransferase [Patescibacteria group bacterium]